MSLESLGDRKSVRVKCNMARFTNTPMYSIMTTPRNRRKSFVFNFGVGPSASALKAARVSCVIYHHLQARDLRLSAPTVVYRAVLLTNVPKYGSRLSNEHVLVTLSIMFQPHWNLRSLTHLGTKKRASNDRMSKEMLTISSLRRTSPITPARRMLAADRPRQNRITVRPMIYQS